MTKLNWDKTRQRSNQRARNHQEKTRTALDTARTQATIYATQHDLACFNCKTRTGPFAAARAVYNTNGEVTRRWALCTACANKRTATSR